MALDSHGPLMGKTQTFAEFLATKSPQASLEDFLLSLGLAAVLGWLLAQLYVRVGRSLSDRRSFAANFLPITLTTTLVITVVKSSLALSLGLVGALSIVRFRAAIKEPEELAFLFLAIGIGLGLGADQRALTAAAFVAIAGAVALARRLGGEPGGELLLTVATARPSELGLQRIAEVVRRHCAAARLRRVEESEASLEAAFAVEIDGLEPLERAKAELRAHDKSLSFSLVDTQGL